MTVAPQPSARLVVHAAGLLLVVAGIATWASVLSRPAPPAPAAATPQGAEGNGTADALAAWFGPGELRANVSVKGLIKGSINGNDQGVAVLAVNDAPPRAYRVGETLAHSVTLAAIEADAVVIDKAGTTERIAAPAMPPLPVPGITRSVAH